MKNLATFINESLFNIKEILFDGTLSQMSNYKLPERFKNINLYNSFGDIIINCYPSKNINDIYYQLSFKSGKLYIKLFSGDFKCENNGNKIHYTTELKFGDLFSENNEEVFKQFLKTCDYINSVNLQIVSSDKDLTQNNIRKIFTQFNNKLYDFEEVKIIQSKASHWDIIKDVDLHLGFFKKIPERIQIITYLNNDKRLKLASSREKNFYCNNINNVSNTSISSNNVSNKQTKINKKKNLVWNDITGIVNFMRQYIPIDKSKISIKIDGIEGYNDKISRVYVYKDKKYKYPEISIYWMGDSTDGNEYVDITPDIIRKGIYISAEHDDYYDDDVDRVKHYTIDYSAGDIKNVLQQVVDKINSGQWPENK